MSSTDVAKLIVTKLVVDMVDCGDGKLDTFLREQSNTAREDMINVMEKSVEESLDHHCRFNGVQT